MSGAQDRETTQQQGQKFVSDGRQGRGAGACFVQALPHQRRRQHPPLQPLVLKGKLEKVITISSGQADLDLINGLEIETDALYSASKAAMNVIVAKFNAQNKKDGVLFVSISPGAVEVGHYVNATPEQIQGLMGFMGKLSTYASHFKGLTPVDEAVRNIRSTWEKASIESGYGGAFVSHLGSKQWL
ncbi:hypothetical protein F4775DRAFT_595072 [Biscogniauxia sp. FL1348]|nr:hypothetical protein F4775DRAFT_595072 [Biscogniauxia sp. FL1348]